MKYKLLKKIESIDSIPVGSIFETVDKYIHMDNGLIIIDEILIEQGFIEKIEETHKPKWKVGDYVVFEGSYGAKKYIKLFEVEKSSEFEYNRGFSESDLRDPTEEELSLYFR